MQADKTCCRLQEPCPPPAAGEFGRIGWCLCGDVAASALWSPEDSEQLTFRHCATLGDIQKCSLAVAEAAQLCWLNVGRTANECHNVPCTGGQVNAAAILRRCHSWHDPRNPHVTRKFMARVQQTILLHFSAPKTIFRRCVHSPVVEHGNGGTCGHVQVGCKRLVPRDQSSFPSADALGAPPWRRPYVRGGRCQFTAARSQGLPSR